MEMDSATGSIDSGNLREDRHHHLIRNTHSIFHSSWSHALLPSFHRSTQFVWFLTHSCQALIDPCNLCGSSWIGIPSYPLTLFLHSLIQNRSFSRIPVRFHVRCSEMWIMGCLRSGSTVSLHRNRLNLVTDFETVLEQLRRCTSKPQWSKLGGHYHVGLERKLQAVIEPVWRYTWGLCLSDFADALGRHDVASLEMHLEAVII